jgi:hypothetical protein
MNETSRGELEGEAYRKSLETLVTARTEQLRQVLIQNSDLLDFLKRIQSMQLLEDIHQAVQPEIAKLESQRPTSPQFGGKPGEPVPEVDPEDLKALWQLQRDVEKQHPGQQVAIGLEVAQHYCKPGADMQAIGYRVSFLWLGTQITPEQFAAFTKDGQPTDAAFRAAAKVPAEWMGVGVARHGPPFDVNEFMRLCAEERRGSEHA